MHSYQEPKSPREGYPIERLALNFLSSPSVGLSLLESLSLLGKALLAFYEGTNITGEKAVNHPKTQLNDALIESCLRQRT